MNKKVSKFLEFNGKRIVLLVKDGTWWIAVKPICEALGVDYIRQFKNLKANRILSQLLSEQTIVAADEKIITTFPINLQNGNISFANVHGYFFGFDTVKQVEKSRITRFWRFDTQKSRLKRCLETTTT